MLESAVRDVTTRLVRITRYFGLVLTHPPSLGYLRRLANTLADGLPSDLMLGSKQASRPPLAGVIAPTTVKGPLVARILPRVLIGLFLVLAAFIMLTLLTSPAYASAGGIDFRIYRDAAARWLAGGFFYYPSQIAGPYETLIGHVMYPPVALVLFVPFTILPAVLWWILPLGATAWCVIALRPSVWGWAIIAACLAWPFSIDRLYTGNPTIWIVAFMALGTRCRWASALVLLKPSLVPFALFGVRNRSWWLAVAAFSLVSVLFLPMWFDWIHVILNARGFFSGPLYSLLDIPIMMIPVVAWWTGQARRSARQDSGQLEDQRRTNTSPSASE